LNNAGLQVDSHYHFKIRKGTTGDDVEALPEGEALEARVHLRKGAVRAVQFSISEQLLSKNVEQFRGGLVVSLNSRLESHKEVTESQKGGGGA